MQYQPVEAIGVSDDSDTVTTATASNETTITAIAPAIYTITISNDGVTTIS